LDLKTLGSWPDYAHAISMDTAPFLPYLAWNYTCLWKWSELFHGPKEREKDCLNTTMMQCYEMGRLEPCTNLSWSWRLLVFAFCLGKGLLEPILKLMTTIYSLKNIFIYPKTKYNPELKDYHHHVCEGCKVSSFEHLHSWSHKHVTIVSLNAHLTSTVLCNHNMVTNN
jgi:hypothetical protein